MKKHVSRPRLRSHGVDILKADLIIEVMDECHVTPVNAGLDGL